MRGVQLVLTPTGSISGRVYDRDGPVGKLQVQALRPIYRDGQRTLTIVQSVQTDDRGEYRLFWLPPGPYYVTAKPFNDRGAGPTRRTRCAHHERRAHQRTDAVGTFEQASSPVVTSRTLPSGEVVEEIQVAVYLPRHDRGERRGADRSAAGASAEGVDIAITTGAVRTRRIRGVVLANGQPVAAAGITAIPRTSDPSLPIPSGRTDADGSFDISGVAAGLVFRVRHERTPGLTGGLAASRSVTPTSTTSSSR